MLRNLKIWSLALLGLTFGACKKLMNVNTNPNVAQGTTLKTLLPAGELYLASAVGVDLQITGAFFSQYWTQNPSTTYYQFLDQYSPQQKYFDNSWTNLYAACENLYQLQNLADSQSSPQYKAIALLLEAYSFQILTDGWGNVPFKQALKGQYQNGNLISPVYDTQSVIYNGIIGYIDSAVKIIKTGSSVVGSEDLIYGGNMTEWLKFAYTLKLKVYMRMSNANPVAAQAGITALLNTAGVMFIGTGDDAFINFTAKNNNPLYAEQNGIGGQNFAASATCIDSMTNNMDPRMDIFYEPTVGGLYAGIQQGNYNGGAVNYSIPSGFVAGDVNNTTSGTAPVNLLTSYESYFLQAEVVARGWGAVPYGYSDNQLFLDGISANFNYYNNQLIAATGTTGSLSYNIYIARNMPAVRYPAAGTVEQKVRYIILQKWYAMCGNQSFEAWTELRRTGLDSILTPSVNSGIGMKVPKRLLYPAVEASTNAKYPGLAPITSKMWWDIY